VLSPSLDEHCPGFFVLRSISGCRRFILHGTHQMNQVTVPRASQNRVRIDNELAVLEGLTGNPCGYLSGMQERICSLIEGGFDIEIVSGGDIFSSSQRSTPHRLRGSHCVGSGRSPKELPVSGGSHASPGTEGLVSASTSVNKRLELTIFDIK